MDAANPVFNEAAQGPERMQERLYHDLLAPDEVARVHAEVRAFAQAHRAPRPGTSATRRKRKTPCVGCVPRHGQGRPVRDPLRRRTGRTRAGLPHGRRTAVAIEELAYVSNSIAASTTSIAFLPAAPRAGLLELRLRYLEPLIAGDVVGCFATTEPEVSTPISPWAPWGPGSRRTVSTSWRAQALDHQLARGRFRRAPVQGRRAYDGGRRRPRRRGRRQGRRPGRKIGNHGQLTADIYLDWVRVPRTNVIGRRGDGLRIALQTLTTAASASPLRASAWRRPCSTNASTASSRRVRQVAQFQHWQFRMAERATEIENARNLYMKAALRMDAGVAFLEPEAGMAKW